MDLLQILSLEYCLPGRLRSCDGDSAELPDVDAQFAYQARLRLARLCIDEQLRLSKLIAAEMAPFWLSVELDNTVSQR